MQAVDKAETDHKLAVANGSTDPTFSIDFGRNPPITIYFGVGINIPLRIFDRNQGEKLRTEIDIRHAERLKDSTQAQVFSDVDSAYFTLLSVLAQLKPYKSTYLQEAADVRDKVSFAYQRGGAALVDFLDAQRDYRAVQQGYLVLVGSYLTAAGQLNMAVGPRGDSMKALRAFLSRADPLVRGRRPRRPLPRWRSWSIGIGLSCLCCLCALLAACGPKEPPDPKSRSAAADAGGARSRR